MNNSDEIIKNLKAIKRNLMISAAFLVIAILAMIASVVLK